MIKKFPILLALCVTLVAFGCGGDKSSGPDTDNDPDDPMGNGTFTAMLDGMAWASAPAYVHASGAQNLPGSYVISGTANPGAASQTLIISLYNIGDTGTYQVGVTPPVVGAYATLTQTNGNYWHSAYTGSAGTVTVTRLDSERIAGTFQFTLSPGLGSNAEGSRVVTGGAFDISLAGDVVPVPPGAGRSVSASFDGAQFYAATVLETPFTGGLAFNALNDDFNLGVVLAEVDGPGVYPLSFLSAPIRSAVVVAGTGGDPANCCWNAIGSTGAVVIEELTDERIIGTFEMVLMPDANSAATEPIVITDGSFDIGREG